MNPDDKRALYDLLSRLADEDVYPPGAIQDRDRYSIGDALTALNREGVTGDDYS